MFFLKTKEGDDIVSEAFETHASATWHMYNDKGEDGEPKWLLSSGKPFVFVWSSPEEEETCPKCGKNTYSFDGDTMVCDSCFHCA